MATCTHEIGTADTGNSPNTTGAFTPVVGDLLIVFVVATDTTDTTGTVSNSVGLTFSQVATATYASSAHRIYCYVSNALVSNAASQTVTWTHSSDTATGTVIFVCAVAGMSRTGLSAVRQSKVLDNNSPGVVQMVFNSACLTENPTFGCVGNSTNPATLGAPTGWTEPAGGDLGYATPTTGGQYVFRNSGFTGNNVDWTGTSASASGSMLVELDTSAPPVAKQLAMLGVG